MAWEGTSKLQWTSFFHVLGIHYNINHLNEITENNLAITKTTQFSKSRTLLKIFLHEKY